MAITAPLFYACLRGLRNNLDALCVINEKLLKHAFAGQYQDSPDELSQRELVAYTVSIVAVLHCMGEALEKLGEEFKE